ncbi:PF04393 domain protein [Haemophilus parahaemolyticus HK385]|uniref:PF04393 domain protein n=1 Tax=Haemophilus parahaemolyticus HK385 TaxID=1095744 RepID=A0ABP2P0L8_HAEPH|nr:PF04393 domain protein [Haemophilus parahaemolyticus HK385]
MPLTIERKSLDDIASKKRSMYHKRYAMLDKILSDIQQF